MSTSTCNDRPFTDSVASDPGAELLSLVRTSDTLVELMQGFFTKLDTRRSQDVQAIADYIAQAKADIHELRPQVAPGTGFPTAGAELQAITQDTEGATNTIMTAAEVMMDFDPSAPDLKAKIDDEVMKIFEACSFQDITGQRVSKIIKVLTQIEERVSRLAEAAGELGGAPAVQLTPEEIRARDLLLNGPAIDGPETRQDEIDALFD